jgi:hypothetical protein
MCWQLSVGAGLLLASLCIAASSQAQEESSPGDRPPWAEATGVGEPQAPDDLEARMEEQARKSKLREEAREREKNRPDFEVIDPDVHIKSVDLLDPAPSSQGGLPEQGDLPDRGPGERDPGDRDLGNGDLPDRDLSDRDLGDGDLPDRDLGERRAVPRNSPSPRGR